MGNTIKISVFNTLESDTVAVSGWYSYKNNPDQRYGLFTRTTGGLDDEGFVYSMKFIAPDINIKYANLHQIYIKIRNCDSGLSFDHIYRNWSEDICIGWLRPGQLGGETANWFFNGENDCWYYGGPRGYSFVGSHRVTCGNIEPSVMPESAEADKRNGQFVRPDYGQSSPTSNNRLYPTGKGSVLKNYMNEDGSDKQPGRLYPTPLHERNQSGQGTDANSSATKGRLYPTGKGSVLKKYMNADGSDKQPERLYPTPPYERKSGQDSEGSGTASKTGGQYVRVKPEEDR